MNHVISEKSRTLKAVIKRIRKVREDRLPVLLQGESGTGKSYLARVLHSQCYSPDGLFLTLDCATFNPNLLESELFGHERGAFTGAHERKSGLFELGCGGTILLDEVENLTPEIQAKLLRVLDENKFRRVGGTEDFAVYFRLLSTVNVEVAALLASGALRKDFYYRIAAVPVTLPPLRERPEDILLFADHFLEELSQKHGKKYSFSRESREVLLNYAWPGNVRELRNAVTLATRLAKTRELGVDDFASILQKSQAGPSLRTLAEVERAHIEQMLRQLQYNISGTARVLGIAENTLRAKMKKYGLRRPAGEK